MTIDEAIKFLETLQIYHKDPIRPGYVDAIKLGMEALKMWKELRKNNGSWFYPLIPGETKE